MTYKAFLIKYAEIAIKGKNRYLFEDALVSQMNHALKKVDGTFHIRKEQGRIYVEMEGEYDYDGAVEALQHVFGIVGICPVVLLEDEGFDALAGEVIRYIDEVYPDRAFYVQGQCAPREKELPVGVDGDQCPDGRADLRGVPRDERGCPQAAGDV